uniref:Uncharacterized protein n=1 Tax=Romanomermis culicivorax TaxID=13658 RepID=A0A915KD80_ROMCU
MPAYHQCSDDEYVLDLALPDWCNMSPLWPPTTDTIPKPLPTIPPTYKIPRKCPCPLPTTIKPPTKKGCNLLSLLHGLTKEPYQFHPCKTLLPISK